MSHYLRSTEFISACLLQFSDLVRKKDFYLSTFWFKGILRGGVEKPTKPLRLGSFILALSLSLMNSNVTIVDFEGVSNIF